MQRRALLVRRDGRAKHRSGSGRIEIAPGVKIHATAIDGPNAIAIPRLEPLGSGTFRPVYRICNPQIPMTKLAEILGVRDYVISRLFHAGFIDGARIAPSSIQVDVLSWEKHVERVQRDRSFWGNQNNLRKYYRAALR
jgi:hypothetical protein